MKKYLFLICISLPAGPAFADVDFSICPDEPGWHVCHDPTDVLKPKNNGIDQDAQALISVTTASTNIVLLNGSDTADESIAMATYPTSDNTSKPGCMASCGQIHIEETGWQS